MTSTTIQPISIPITQKFMEDASRYAIKIVFSSFQQGMKPIFGDGGITNHLRGKIGEMAFYEFCIFHGIAVKHKPFRDDYSVLDDQDDFKVILKDKLAQVEVKTTKLKNPLKIPDDQIVFYNKLQFDQKKNHRFLVVFAATNPEMTQVVLLGWIPAPKIKGFPIRNDIKSPAYVIQVRSLSTMQNLLEVNKQ
jgi:hypothetical protein